MARIVVYDKDGKPTQVEAVDAREMVKHKNEVSLEPPAGQAPATLADVETQPGEPQYPPTPQPEHPLPTPHEVLLKSVQDSRDQRSGKTNSTATPVRAPGSSFPVPPKAPQFADGGPTPGTAPTPVENKPGATPSTVQTTTK